MPSQGARSFPHPHPHPCSTNQAPSNKENIPLAGRVNIGHTRRRRHISNFSLYPLHPRLSHLVSLLNGSSTTTVQSRLYRRPDIPRRPDRYINAPMSTERSQREPVSSSELPPCSIFQQSATIIKANIVRPKFRNIDQAAIKAVNSHLLDIPIAYIQESLKKIGPRFAHLNLLTTPLF